MNSPHKNPRLLRRVSKGVSSLSGRYLSAQRFYQNARRPFAHRAMHRPFVGHQDFRGLLNGGDVPDYAAVQNFDGRLEPNAAGRGRC